MGKIFLNFTDELGPQKAIFAGCAKVGQSFSTSTSVTMELITLEFLKHS